MTDPPPPTRSTGSRLRGVNPIELWRRAFRHAPKLVLPIAVLALGGVATLGLVAVRPEVSTRKPQHRSPLVRVVRAVPATVQLEVRSQGTVVPRTESVLVAEVSGRIIEVSASLASGGFLDPDEVLVTIDPSDYEIALERAEAALARAASRFANAKGGLERQQRLVRRGVGSAADLDDSRSAQQVAEADLRDARAARAQALADLERTRVRVPFAGRVREKLADVGQYVTRGTAVARVYAVDWAEVRLPIPDREAAFVDLPIDYRDDEDAGTAPQVLLHATFAGRDYTWTGRIVRTEGELDPKTRMIHAVARVEDPYGRSDDPDRPPLSVGLFVQAEIAGRERPDVVVLPRAALRGRDEVAIVDAEGRIELRSVEVLRREGERVLLASGVERGEQVVIGPLAIAVDGMRVRIQGDAPIQRAESPSTTDADATLAAAADPSASARATEALAARGRP